jgi:pyruvate ferredoxin oxidoreductase alpha subunit
MIKILKGNYACAEAVKLSQVDVISAYPITPATPVVEKLSEEKDKGNLKSEFILVESEQGSITVCIAASSTGARTFTATSANGLALMHEQLHWASGSRLPIVLSVANRSMTSPWSIWCDHQDSISQRDTGWIQLYCENNQDIFDTTIQAFKIAETVRIPVMVCYDGFILSHVSMPVNVPSQENIKKFLPASNITPLLNIDEPLCAGSVILPTRQKDENGNTVKNYFDLRIALQNDFLNAIDIIRDINIKYNKVIGSNSTGLFSLYEFDDAEYVIIAMGSITSELKDTIQLLRQVKIKAGLITLKSYRPFPAERLISILNKKQKIIVFDKNISYGYQGALHTDMLAALYHHKMNNEIQGIIAGMGGHDTKSKTLYDFLKNIIDNNIFNKKFLYLDT